MNWKTLRETPSIGSPWSNVFMLAVMHTGYQEKSCWAWTCSTADGDGGGIITRLLKDLFWTVLARMAKYKAWRTRHVKLTVNSSTRLRNTEKERNLIPTKHLFTASACVQNSFCPLGLLCAFMPYLWRWCHMPKQSGYLRRAKYYLEKYRKFQKSWKISLNFMKIQPRRS